MVRERDRDKDRDRNKDKKKKRSGESRHESSSGLAKKSSRGDVLGGSKAKSGSGEHHLHHSSYSLPPSPSLSPRTPYPFHLYRAYTFAFYPPPPSLFLAAIPLYPLYSAPPTDHCYT